MSRFEYFMKSCEPEEILEHDKTKSFDEFIWTMGGDVYRSRVYGDSPDTYYMTEK